MTESKLSTKPKWFLRLQRFSARAWYPELVGALGGLDLWIIVVPIDGIVISSVLLQPRRWMRFVFSVSILSTLGAFTLAYAVVALGLPFVEGSWPSLLQSSLWLWTQNSFLEYGILIVFLSAAMPIAQQPALCIAALAHTPLPELTLAYLLGRICKYSIICYIAAKLPHRLSRLWGVQSEMEQAGVERSRSTQQSKD